MQNALWNRELWKFFRMEAVMTKNTKIFIMVLACITMLCLIIGIVTRNSYVGYRTFKEMAETENLQEYSVQLSDAKEYDYFAASVENYEDLEKISDVIVKISVTNERKLFPHTTTKTKVIVEEVWKGEVQTGQPIFIYEPAHFSYIVSKSFESIGGYQLMEEGKEYYLFLQNLNAPEGYSLSKKEKNSYLPSTASFSKFPVQEGEVKLADKQRLNRDQYHYGEIQNLEIITSKETVLSKYKEIKECVVTCSHHLKK